MSNNEAIDRKRYWMKFYARFFDKHEIKILLAEDRDYVFFYIAMLLESIAHNGRVRYNEKRPYTPVMLSRLVNMPVEKVEKSIDALKDADLLEVLDDGTIFLRAAPDMCGCTDYSSDRTRRWREAKRKVIDEEKQVNEVKNDNTKSQSKEITDTGLKYPREKLEKFLTPERMAGAITPNEISPFIDYLIEKGFCEKPANQGITLSYLKQVARSWKRDGGADVNRHIVTRDELHERVVVMNKNRDTKISADDESRFWDFLSSRPEPFTHKGGDIVTKYTVGAMLNAWKENERGKRDADDEESASRDKWSHYVLTNEDGIDE
jgi:predicted phage replisome organizer